VSERTQPPPAGQASRLAGLPVRLFALQAAGSAPDLAPLRALLASAEHNLEVLRFAAEDAVGADPMMPPLAQYADVHQHGAELEECLAAALIELDVLAVALAEAVRGREHHVS
jgi:hypothetical protein